MASQSKPKNLVPEFSTLDAMTLIRFQWTPVGSPQVAYYLQIYDITSGSTLVYNSGVVVTTDTFLELAEGTLSNDRYYTWNVTVYKDGVNYIQSEWIIFATAQRPTVTIPFYGVSGQSFKFTGVPIVAAQTTLQKFIFNLYSSTGELVDTSGEVFSSTCEYIFSGLISNQTYVVECIVTDQLGQSGTSGYVVFTPVYTSTDPVQLLEVIVDNDNAYNTVNWGLIKLSTGIIFGVGYFV